MGFSLSKHPFLGSPIYGKPQIKVWFSSPWNPLPSPGAVCQANEAIAGEHGLGGSPPNTISVPGNVGESIYFWVTQYMYMYIYIVI